MITNPRDFLTGIVIGIRFRVNFSLEDKFGSIADSILYSKDSYFNPTLFPGVLTNPTEKVLLNEQTNDNLRINTSNIILEVNLGGQKILDDVPEINERFNRDIVKGVMKEFKITQINRVGYVKKYTFTIDDFPKAFIKKTIGSSLGDVNDINLRFSKKYPIGESLTKKKVNDYHNAIYNVIKKADKDELFISIDYQGYYDPFLESANQVDFPKFLGEMERYNSKTFLDWLNSYFKE